MGCCRVRHHCCPSCPRILSQHSVPHSMPQLSAKHSCELHCQQADHGTALCVSREEK